MAEVRKPSRIVCSHGWSDDRKHFQVLVESEGPITRREVLEVVLIKAVQLLHEMDEEARPVSLKMGH